jgi:hypothetical protein
MKNRFFGRRSSKLEFWMLQMTRQKAEAVVVKGGD